MTTKTDISKETKWGVTCNAIRQAGHVHLYHQASIVPLKKNGKQDQTFLTEATLDGVFQYLSKQLNHMVTGSKRKYDEMAKLALTIRSPTMKGIIMDQVRLYHSPNGTYKISPRTTTEVFTFWNSYPQAKTRIEQFVRKQNIDDLETTVAFETEAHIDRMLPSHFHRFLKGKRFLPTVVIRWLHWSMNSLALTWIRIHLKIDCLHYLTDVTSFPTQPEFLSPGDFFNERSKYLHEVTSTCFERAMQNPFMKWIWNKQRAAEWLLKNELAIAKKKGKRHFMLFDQEPIPVNISDKTIYMWLQTPREQEKHIVPSANTPQGCIYFTLSSSTA